MRSIFNAAVAGVIAVALMIVAKLLLSQQAVLVAQWHYPPFHLQGQEGLQRLGTYALWAAAYGAVWQVLLRGLLPGGILWGPLALGAVPTLVAALVLPLRAGGAAIRDPWTLLWLYAHWTLWAACFLFISGGKGGAKAKEE